MALEISLLQVDSHSADETRSLGAILGRLLWPGAVVCLEGNLGAGKTCLAQGIGQGLGVSEPVISPTFTLIREYRGRMPLFHVDCYRLSSPDDAWALGLDDYLYDDGVTVLEWADRVRVLIPEERLWVRLEDAGGEERKLFLTATGEPYRSLLGRLTAPADDV